MLDSLNNLVIIGSTIIISWAIGFYTMSKLQKQPKRTDNNYGKPLIEFCFGISGLNRCGKSCRLRWLNYLRPDIKRGNITEEEEDLILRLHKLLGNRWSLIAGRLPGRTDNEIKNYWNTYLSKKMSGSSPDSFDSKKAQSGVLDEEKGTFSEADLIRTKAVRCSTPVLADQEPSYAMKSSSHSIIRNDALDHDLYSNSVIYHAFLEDANPIYSSESMQNPQTANAASYMSSESIYGSCSTLASDYEYDFTSIFTKGFEGAEGIYNLMNSDPWNLFLHH